jgi:Arm DNA-binding domain
MLSDTTIRAARPRDRSCKLSDELGLFLLVTPQGGRWWRFEFRFDRKEQLLSLGVYPGVSLAEAQKKRDSMRRD